MSSLRRSKWLALFGPGILIAATGVGAGDLVTASLAGSELGVVVVWGAVIGSLLKWSLNEGIARWQLATGTTLLEGWSARLGPWFSWIFLVYFIVWSFVVGGALISACGIAGTALLPIGDPETSKVVWGVIHSVVSGLLAWKGGFKRFEQVMSICIGIMVVSVVVTAALLVAYNPSGIAAGLFRLPTMRPEDWRWFLGVLGGVGGTVTILSYGYWIREAGRRGEEGLRTSRIDLAASYAMTGLFGVAMVIIGSRLTNTGTGARVAVQLADQLAGTLGPFAKWLFLAGFWGAVFTSILGVWQSAPYLFADFWRTWRGNPLEGGHAAELRRSPPYHWFLLGIATLPMLTLWFTVKQIQLAYTTVGAWFMPLLALTLLVMNNRKSWVGSNFRNGWGVNLLLVLTLVVFAYMAIAGVGE